MTAPERSSDGDDATVEALARSLRETLGHDEWFELSELDARDQAIRLRRRFRAKGFDVVRTSITGRDAADRMGRAIG